MSDGRYESYTFPASRIGTIDLGRIGARKHHIAALLEVDVTTAVSLVRRRRIDGGRTSFFAWLTKTIGDAIAEYPHMHAMRKGKYRSVMFENVDISIMVEKRVDGRPVPLPLLVRATNRKSADEIHAEIEAAKGRSIADESDYVISDRSVSRVLMRLYYGLPQPLRLLAMRLILRNPHRAKRMMGTAIVTTTGAAGHLAGWVIPKAMHNLCFAIGPIVKKPWVVNGDIAVRTILHLTVLVDHDVVDGIPAARFFARLVNRIQRPENGK